MHSLPLFVRLTGRPVILVGQGEAAKAKRRLLERAGATIVGLDAPAALAIVAEEEDSAAQAAVAGLKERGVLVNAVDRPQLCDFTLPAIVDRDPLIVAVGTGGASAGLAKIIRQRIERLLPAGLGALATALAAARPRIKERWPDPAARRRAIDAALAEGGPLDPLGERRADALDLWLEQGETPLPDRLERIILTSPDPDELTLRTARLMGEADRIFHDPALPAAILQRARADAERIAGAPPATPGPGLSLHLVLRR